ncbi:MAG: hypothetical protein ABJG47_18280 [Ekhidna sp.]
MNKSELITFLRDPTKLSSEQLEELEAIVDENPYFLSARLLLAKASKEQKHAETKKRVASAAIYSTDRVLLKKYLNGDLFFLSQPHKASESDHDSEEHTPDRGAEVSGKIPIVSKTNAPVAKEKDTSGLEETKKESKEQNRDTAKVKSPGDSSSETAKSIERPSRSDKRPAAITKVVEKKQLEVPELPSGDLDSILEELQQDMANLKNSREKFSEVQQKIEEDDAVSAALEKASSKEESKPPTVEVTSDQLVPESESEHSKEDEEEKEAEAAKKSASEITMQILAAAKKAKEEVDNEDRALIQEDTSEEQPSPAADTVDSDEKLSSNSEISPEEEVKEVKPIAEKQKSEKTDSTSDSERAERVIREPRFSRFSSRSYLNPTDHIDPAGFLKDDKDELKEKPADKIKDDTDKEESSSEIKLPDLSKAKPVARKSRRSSKRKDEESSKKATVKEPEEDAKAVKETNVSKAAKEKPATKKKVSTKTTAKKKEEKESKEKKPTQKKVVAKKTTTKKKVVAKKETAKKTKPKASTKAKSNASKEEKKEDDTSDRKDQQDIIDKFIKESPSIKYQRKEPLESEDLAEQSAAWDPNLASEYLAEIYLHQGNKKRAIEIYEALSLKYPEKKSYFADLISKIE